MGRASPSLSSLLGEALVCAALIWFFGTVGGRIQCRIKCILTRGSNDTRVNFIGKKSTEVALIHSDFQGIFPLKWYLTLLVHVMCDSCSYSKLYYVHYLLLIVVFTFCFPSLVLVRRLRVSMISHFIFMLSYTFVSQLILSRYIIHSFLSDGVTLGLGRYRRRLN